MLSKEGFDALGPVFAMNGWVFFGPYRRGQGLSASVGKYIGDEIAAATKTGGLASGSAKMVRLLETDHLNDQVAALTWLRTQKFVEADRSEEHTSELQSRGHLVCRLLLEKINNE